MIIQTNPEAHSPQVAISSLPGNLETPDDLFFEQLRALHSMELQLGNALPEVAAMAGDREIGELITMQVFRTAKRAARLASMLRENRQEIGTEACEAVSGLVSAGNRQLRSTGHPSTRDMMILAYCQRIQNHGLSAYEVASQLADALGREAEAKLLESPLVENRTAIRRLEVISDRLFGPKPLRKSIFPAIFSGSTLEWRPAVAASA